MGGFAVKFHAKLIYDSLKGHRKSAQDFDRWTCLSAGVGDQWAGRFFFDLFPIIQETDLRKLTWHQSLLWVVGQWAV